MKIIKLGSRTIRIYFSDRKVDEHEKSKRGKRDGYCHGYSDKETDTICIRKSLPDALKRICLWHELSHLTFDFLGSFGDEGLAEINGRLIDEVLIRNHWIIRELYR